MVQLNTSEIWCLQTHPSHSLFRCLQDYTKWHHCLWTTYFSMIAMATIINRTNVAGWMNILKVIRRPPPSWDAVTHTPKCKHGLIYEHMTTLNVSGQANTPYSEKNTCLCLFSIPERERKHNSLEKCFHLQFELFFPNRVSTGISIIPRWPLRTHRSLSAWRHERASSSSFALTMQDKARADMLWKQNFVFHRKELRNATIHGNRYYRKFTYAHILFPSRFSTFQNLFVDKCHLKHLYLYFMRQCDANVSGLTDRPRTRVALVYYSTVATLATFLLTVATFCVN